MGQRTRAQIVQNGLLVAGNPSLTPLANGWLNTWLQTTFDSWPWPWLYRKAVPFALPQGITSIAFGFGAANSPAEPVRRILDPVWLFDSNYTALARIRVKQIYGGVAFEESDINNPATFIGQPQWIRVRETTPPGQWLLEPSPLPDRAYLLKLDYIAGYLFIDETSAGDSSHPSYPNDRTMELSVTRDALIHMKKFDEANAISAQLENLVVTDRMRYGQNDGTNDLLGLDETTFPPRGRITMWQGNR